MSALSVGILGFGTSCGDRMLTAAELAAMHGTTEENVHRTLGSCRVYLSDKSSEELALDAAQRCLQTTGVPPAELDMIIFCNGSKRRARFGASGMLQHALGAENAVALDFGLNCSEVPMAMRVARGLIRDSAEVRKVLIVAGEQWGEWAPLRSGEKIDDKNHPNLVSDGGGALLVGPSEQNALVGFGFATVGKYYDVMQVEPIVVDGKVVERGRLKPDLPPEQQLSIDITRLFRVALSRCLKDSGLRRDELDHVVLPLSGPALQTGFARALGVPIDRIVRYEGAPTHIGAPDVMHGLEAFLASGRGAPGQHVLLAARSSGIMRFAVVRC